MLKVSKDGMVYSYSTNVINWKALFAALYKTKIHFKIRILAC